MNQYAITAWSDYLHGVDDGSALPSLDARLNAVVRERYRRIDRFIALSVMGAGECAARAQPDPDCGLYLSSGVGPVGSNTQVQSQLCLDRLLPKPFNFVNTLGSAAGHYVAKNLGLAGQNLFITCRGDAFQSALEVALVDLELGIVSQALVGAVEECSLPLGVHRRRQSLPPDAAVAEGTHWVMIEPRERAKGGLPFALRRFESDVELEAWLRQGRGGQWSIAGRTDAARKLAWQSALGGAPLYDPELIFHDSRDAAVVTHWLEHGDRGRLTLLSPSGRAGVRCLQFGA